MVEATLGRHHRTALLLGALTQLRPEEAAALLDRITIGVSASAAAAGTAAGQAATLTAVNVVARTGGAVALALPAAPLLLRGLPWSGTLDDVARELVVWCGARIGADRRDADLHIGYAPWRESVVAMGDAWSATVDDRSSSSQDATHLGAIAAAHLGAARAFHIALAVGLGVPGPTREPIHFALRSGGQSPEHDATREAIGPTTTLVGAGAVGQAMLWALGLGGVRLRKQLRIVDPQTLDRTNLNRHLLAGTSDVGLAKADVAVAFASRFGDAVAFVRRFNIDDATQTIISTVDNDETRYEIQGSLPGLVLHGATSRETVGVGVLDLADGACLGCLFPRAVVSHAARIAGESGLGLGLVEQVLAADGPVTTEMLPSIAMRLGIPPQELAPLVGRPLKQVYATDLCGRLPIGSRADAPTATVAYVSGFAGVLLASELTKLASPGLVAERLRNYVQVDVLRPQHAWYSAREKQDDCPLMCSSDALQAVARARRLAAPGTY